MADTTPTDSGTIPDPPTGEDMYADAREPDYRPGLARARDGRVVAGVAQGLAATWGTRPWLVRAGFVVTSALAGLGVVLYLLGWLLMPEAGEAESVAQRMVRRMNVQPTWVGFVLLLAGTLVLAGIAGISGGVLVAAGLLVGGYVLYRGDFTMPEAPSRPDAPGAAPPSYVYQRQARSPKPPRPRSYLGRLTVGSTFVTLGIMGALDALDVATPTSRHYAAAALLVLGIGLLVGTLLGRSRGLIFLGLLLLPALAVAAITDFRFGTTFDNVEIRPETVEEIDSSYALEAGHLHLDLTAVDFSGHEVAIDIDLGVGNLIVEVPRSVTLEATADTRLGDANVLGTWSSGLGADVTRTIAGADANGGKLILDADLRMGSISIHRDDYGEFFDRNFPFFDRRSIDPSEITGAVRDGASVFELGSGIAELAPNNVGDVAGAYVLGGGHLILDLSNIATDETLHTTFAGDGAVTVAVPNDASVTIVSVTPFEGVDGPVVFTGDFYELEQPGFGPHIFIEGFGPHIRVER